MKALLKLNGTQITPVKVQEEDVYYSHPDREFWTHTHC